MKREGFCIVISLMSLIFLISFACAAGCESKYVIFKISGESNAHAEIHDQDNYNVKICYSDFFSGSVGENPWKCDGKNIVLKLSAPTNAHAEGPHGLFFNTDVCYGNLRCESRTICESDEIPIVRLSSPTNAHLEVVESTTYSGGDTRVICCKVGGTGIPTLCGNNKVEGSEICDGTDLKGKDCKSLGYEGGTLKCKSDCTAYDASECTGELLPLPEAKVYWADRDNNVLSTSYTAYADDLTTNQLRMIADGFEPGIEVEFKLYEDDIIDDDTLRTGDGMKKIADLGGRAYLDVELMMTDYENGKETGEDEILEVYFTANSMKSMKINFGNTNPNLPPTPVEEEGCKKYKTQSECNNDVDEEWKNDADQLNVDCTAPTTCTCFWEVNNNKCVFKRIQQASSGPLSDGTKITWTCNDYIEISDCINGITKYTTKTNFIILKGMASAKCEDIEDATDKNKCTNDEGDCENRNNKEREVSCGIPTLQMDFFWWNQFLICVFIFSMAYFVRVFKYSKAE